MSISTEYAGTKIPSVLYDVSRITARYRSDFLYLPHKIHPSISFFTIYKVYLQKFVKCCAMISRYIQCIQMNKNKILSILKPL